MTKFPAVNGQVKMPCSKSTMHSTINNLLDVCFCIFLWDNIVAMNIKFRMTVNKLIADANKAITR